MWFKPNWAVGDGLDHYFFEAGIDALNMCQLQKNFLNNLIGGWYDGSEYRVSVASPTINTGAWNSIFLTWHDADNDTFLYLNGISIGSNLATLNPLTTTSNRTIGNRVAGFNNFNFDGRIGHGALWPTVIGQAGATAFHAGTPANAIGSGIVNYWKLKYDTLDSVGTDHLTNSGATLDTVDQPPVGGPRGRGRGRGRSRIGAA